VIFVGALLAATTGVVAASVISMGLISLPIMLRYGYDKRWPPASSPPPARWRRSSRRRWC
jgi:TRAP-type mannitol/chloroaromatic compound transport system permease large subunit